MSRHSVEECIIYHLFRVQPKFQVERLHFSYQLACRKPHTSEEASELNLRRGVFHLLNNSGLVACRAQQRKGVERVLAVGVMINRILRCATVARSRF